MTERRIYLPQELSAGQRLQLPAAVFRHVVQVLRMLPGEPLVLFNGEGGEYDAELEAVGKREAFVKVGRFRGVDRESPLKVTLAQGVSKGERMDFTIQKAVELGVHEIQPLLSERCVVKLDEERWARKLEHWQSVVVAACEQSGRTRVPKVLPVVDLRDWLQTVPAESHKLVLSPTASAPLPAKLSFAVPLVLVIGPEGGLAEIEIKLAELAGFNGLRLGPRVLRTETAGVVAMSVVQALWGDLGIGKRL